MNVKENRAFSNMLTAAQDRLAGHSPLEIAEKAHVIFDQNRQAFLFSSLRENITCILRSRAAAGAELNGHSAVVTGGSN